MSETNFKNVWVLFFCCDEKIAYLNWLMVQATDINWSKSKEEDYAVNHYK